MSREDFDKNMQELIGTDDTVNTVKDICMKGGRILTGIGASKIADNFCHVFGRTVNASPFTRVTVCLASFVAAGEMYDKGMKAFDHQIEEIASTLVDIKEMIKGE